MSYNEAINRTAASRTKSIILALAAIATAALTSSGADRAVELLKGFEGFRAKPYLCEAGRKTIGYGFTSKEWTSRKSVSESEAAKELKRLADGIAAKLRAELGEGNRLTANEEAAVVSFIYNIGWWNFKNSTMCRLLKEGRRGAVVAAEFHRWVYVTKDGRKTVSEGLKNRRRKEARCFLKG